MSRSSSHVAVIFYLDSGSSKSLLNEFSFNFDSK